MSVSYLTATGQKKEKKTHHLSLKSENHEQEWVIC
jgi:hypothetical protein